MWARIKTFLLGGRRDIHDPKLFHKVSLIAFMAWVGLGADGLSSSAYGPEEAFKGLGEHKELVLFLAVATALTVFIISYAYSRIIEHFPFGGGGYVVATKLLGAPFGVISGCALLVDYVLTISVSIASGADQIFSFLPLSWHAWKVPFEAAAIVLLIVLNLRGVKESVTVLTPIFVFFVLSHIVLLGASFFTHVGHAPAVISQARSGLSSGLVVIGFAGLFKIFARAYAQGAGTFTGIEAVSNGVQVMRDPKVQTAKRTMVYMATSLALTAAGLLIVYTLVDVKPQEGKTLNAVLSETLGFGTWFVVAICVAEAALLVIAAQTGFIDGPRVMANMAHDSWLPHRFSSLSERLTTHYGILLIGGAALATLFSTGGNTDKLVYMYSINVFVTFSLSELGMCKFWVTERRTHADWKRHLPVHATGLILCTSILALQVSEKWTEGGRETAAITLGLIIFCFIIKAHYRRVQAKLALISADKLAPADMISSRALAENPPTLDPAKPTAVLLVGGYNGLGVHSVLALWRMFTEAFPQIIFVGVGVLESGNFKAQEDVDRLKGETQAALNRYIALANRMGMAASSRMSIGTDPVQECEKLCLDLSKEFPRSTFFAGKLVFQKPKWYHWILHNQTAQAIQQRLEWDGMPMIVLPVRVRG
jgi:amino acid transporter